MLEARELLQLFQKHPVVDEIRKSLNGCPDVKLKIENGVGSVLSFIAAVLGKESEGVQLFVLNDKEEAAYFYNDLLFLLGEEKLRFLPASFRRSGNFEDKDNDSILVRTEVLNALVDKQVGWVVTYTEALAEKVVNKEVLADMSMPVSKGDKLSISFLEDLLSEYNFERSDFVYEPGQFSIRGSIVDIYSFAEERPVRLDFFGDEVESIRYFDVETQLSEQQIERIVLVPDLSETVDGGKSGTLAEFLGKGVIWWLKNTFLIRDRLNTLKQDDPGDLLVVADDLLQMVGKCPVVEWGSDLYFRGQVLRMETELQPAVNKQFDLLAEHLQSKQREGYTLCVCSNNEMQLQRLRDIFSDKGYIVNFKSVEGTIHEGFCDVQLRICIYTEHQIFDRYHKYRLKTTQIRKGRESITISELQNLHPGDYVVHVDHGIGRFGGLVKINNDGREQEAIRLVYKNNSELYVSLHALHKISKYKGKDGVPPVVNKLGGDAWNRLKQKTKSRVKDIARELIALYAKRRKESAFAYSKDSYLQEEMEASFMYEETPDQMKAIQAVKEDMENPHVMDRLVCGDVGFGKTEVAIRAAFKAVADSKQVAVLVPTTVLAYQHYNTFIKRLAGMPCRVEYISRMKKSSDIKRVLRELSEGKVDIIIGTHRLTSSDVHFKDLGLLIIDEEQKFGVAVKERLKHLKLNVDTITMTATPIPRTLQFSLMGARDMSIIRTPPPNRYPIVTELHRFDEKVIKEAISYELARGGQVFFIHNRVENIREIQYLIHRLIPGVKSCVAHGQMNGEDLETVMHDFIRGDYDVLIATTIVESGLDIPNANTMIINQAQNYGLSDLHQLRGRVGRSNRKAFCYLLTPPLELINQDARRRLKAIEDYSGLGSGFNIAMQDLDIRGAGNILGGEQSGFIAEIGYETYQRILNEALLELRDEEFPELEERKSENNEYFSVDCVIDTDFEILIPEAYVENVSERIRLYRELDNITDENTLQRFEIELRDRFGEIPVQVEALMEVVRIRRRCVNLGIERLLVKNGKMVAYFIGDQHSSYYASAIFTAVLKFVQKQVVPCKMSERNDKLTLVFTGIENIGRVSGITKAMEEFTEKN
ncbi:MULTISPECIES: transcription-repair coupling factor [Porphyromonadaceae]|uniref:transcription-repair coupling factor n=1 Tax=Porphyromonadaceae TaxID=171551 RepID=UPI000AB54286|nr:MULTISPECIES: transcription-repair coupling factor [Porphyromonadaceae]